MTSSRSCTCVLLLLAVTAFVFDYSHASILSKSSHPIQLLMPDANHKILILNESALDVLRALPSTSPLRIISVVGAFKGGKSYLLNRLTNRSNSSNGFNVGGSVKPTTMGIWMDISVNSPHVDGDPIDIYLDTEGFFASGSTAEYDSKLFAIAALSASTLIYNSVRTIDHGAIEQLETLAWRAHLFRAKAASGISETNNNSDRASSSESSLHLSFPSLVWVVQNFFQTFDDSEATCSMWLHGMIKRHNHSMNDYEAKSTLEIIFPKISCFTVAMPSANPSLLRDLSVVSDENLTSEYKNDITSLSSAIHSDLSIKYFGTSVNSSNERNSKTRKGVNGSTFLTLLSYLVAAANDGLAFPRPESTWALFLSKQRGVAIDLSLKHYGELMNPEKNGPRTKSELDVDHVQASISAVDTYKSLLFGIVDIINADSSNASNRKYSLSGLSKLIDSLYRDSVEPANAMIVDKHLTTTLETCQRLFFEQLILVNGRKSSVLHKSKTCEFIFDEFCSLPNIVPSKLLKSYIRSFESMEQEWKKQVGHFKGSFTYDRHYELLSARIDNEFNRIKIKNEQNIASTFQTAETETLSIFDTQLRLYWSNRPTSSGVLNMYINKARVDAKEKWTRFIGVLSTVNEPGCEASLKWSFVETSFSRSIGSVSESNYRIIGDICRQQRTSAYNAAQKALDMFTFPIAPTRLKMECSASIQMAVDAFDSGMRIFEADTSGSFRDDDVTKPPPSPKVTEEWSLRHTSECQILRKDLIESLKAKCGNIININVGVLAKIHNLHLSAARLALVNEINNMSIKDQLIAFFNPEVLSNKAVTHVKRALASGKFSDDLNPGTEVVISQNKIVDIAEELGRNDHDIIKEQTKALSSIAIYVVLGMCVVINGLFFIQYTKLCAIAWIFYCLIIRRSVLNIWQTGDRLSIVIYLFPICYIVCILGQKRANDIILYYR